MTPLRVVDRDGQAVDVTRYATGVKWTYSCYGGATGLTARINMPLSRLNLGAGSVVQVDDPVTGDVAWSGEATRPAPTKTSEGEWFDLVALGDAARLQRRAEPLAYVLRDNASQWVRSSNSVKGATTDADERGDGTPTLDVSAAEGKKVRPLWQGEWILRTVRDAGLTVGGIYVSLDNGPLEEATEGPPGTWSAITLAVDPDFSFRIRAGTSASTLRTVSRRSAGDRVGADVFATDLFATLTSGLTAADSVVALMVDRTTSTVRAEGKNGLWFRFADLRVLPARYDVTGALATTGYGDVGTVNAAAVIADMVGRGMCPGLDPAKVVIDPALTYPIDQLDWLDGVTMGDALGDLTVWHPEMWWAVDQGAATFGRFAGAPRYIVDHRHTVEQPGASDDARFNRILVTWTDARDKQRTTRVTASVPGLSGVRDYVQGVTLPDGFGTPANAQRAGESVLAALNAQAQTASATVSGRVWDDLAGCWVRHQETRPGCLVQVARTGQVFRLTDVEVTDAAAQWTLDRPPRSVEQILARLKRRRGKRRF